MKKNNMRVLIVVDMQNDFIDGSLGSVEAKNIVPNVINKIKEYENELIYFTKDTLKYSFSVTPLDVRSYEFRMPIKILGCLSSEVREVAYRINPDSTNAEEGVERREPSYTVGANAS